MNLGNIFILGDSYSAFDGTLPEGYVPYYGTADFAAQVELTDMWWSHLLRITGSTLVMNNSWSGSPICRTQYGTYSPNAAFCNRARRYIKNGTCCGTPIDTVIIFGGTNDAWGETPLGKISYGPVNDAELRTVFPAFCDVLSYLSESAPHARLITVLNCDLPEELNQGLLEISAHYGAVSVSLKGIEKLGGHPTKNGMKAICDQIMEVLTSSDAE